MAVERGKLRRGLEIAGVALLVIAVVIFFPRRIHKPVNKLIHVSYAVDDQAFRQSVGDLINRPLLPGNKVTTLLNGDTIFPAMLSAIRNAQKTVTLETFIFHSGAVSRDFIPALCERARAGVKVHVIIDSVGCAKLKEAEVDALKHAGAQVVKYNRPEWIDLLRVNHRDHRKILVVDGRVGFTGGACLADEWMGNATSKKHWRDTQFRLEGPAVGQLQGVFMDNWITSRGEVLHGPDFFPVTSNGGTVFARCYKTGPDDSLEAARLVFLYSIAAARRSIRMEHAYFVPDDLLIDAMIDARRRGVKVEIITPGVIDEHVVRRASRARWNELLDAGVEFFEYQPALFHCKTMVVDDIWVTAGSVNFDDRSFRINDENALDVWDKDFAAEQVKIFEDDKAKSRRISPGEYKARSWHAKVIDYMASYLRAWL